MDTLPKEDRATITENPKGRRFRAHAAEGETALKLVKLTADVSSSMPPKDKKKVESKKLRKRLLEVAEKNESLAKTITDRNEEIAELKRSVQSLNDVLNSVPISELRCNSSIAGSKILELSKKNRVMRAELETTKNRLTKKDLEILKLERELKILHDKDRPDSDIARKATITVDELQTKLSNVQQKLFETRNKNTELQTQLKLAQKCLQQEVGENFNLNTLAASGALSNWRGRAQQILNLQQRVHELRERLDACEGRSSARQSGGYSSQDFTNDALVPVSAGQTSGSPEKAKAAKQTAPRSLSNYSCSNIDRFTPGVRKSELLHRAKVDMLESEINTLKMQLEEQRGKILALKVRNKTLNDEVLKHKVKACSLQEEHTDYNEMNLATMNEKLTTQKYQFEQRIDEICREMASVVRKRELAESKEEEMRNKLENLEETLASKDEFIDELQEAVRRLETDLKAVCGGFLFSCRELRKEEFIAILDSLEAEKDMLLQHNKILTERTDHERDKNANLSEQIAKQKMRVCRLEAKIRDLEKELEGQNDRKKRSQRIADYANSISSSSLTSFVFENSSYGKLGSKSDEQTQLKVDDMKNQLEVSTEKINLLEEKIANLKLEKEQDSKLFSQTMANTKNTILEAIIGHRSEGDIAVHSDDMVE